MVFNSHGYVVYDSTTANEHIDLSLSLSKGNVLTRMSIRGTLSQFSASGTVNAGSTVSDQFCAGVQYGAAGYGGTPLTMGNIQSNNWVTWGELIPGHDETEIIPGTVPITVWVNSGRRIELDWWGTFTCTQNTDFYTAFGCNPGQAINFTLNYRFYAEWAS